MFFELVSQKKEQCGFSVRDLQDIGHINQTSRIYVTLGYASAVKEKTF